mgnify:FL=1|jgi:NAD(P)-dependent dehydrogenase (short-subunit alcohol dehydrogenase family)
MEMNGRVAVVTGAASGIGLAIVERLVEEKMSVVMADIEAEALTQQADRLISAGAPVTPVVCDVADSDAIQQLKEKTLETYGAVHLLANNAGVASGQVNYKTPPAVWRWMVEVNILGVAYGISAFAPLMIEQGEGHIINTASEAGLASSALLGAYHATKYAVVGLSESLALELSGTGVGVSCLCPELVATRIFESTRNAPAELGFPPAQPVAIGDIEQWMQSTAMNPRDVAADVAHAVRANRFWILTHQVSHQRVRHRNEDLEVGRNPRPRLDRTE